MGIKGLLVKAGNKAADTVASLSVLSPKQLEEMSVRRNGYLLQMPDMNDENANEMTSRLLAACGIEVYQEYLQHLDHLYAPIEKELEYETGFNASYNIRYFNITKWVTDKRENSLEKLVNVYDVLSNEDCNIALVFHRTTEQTDVYLAVTNTRNADDNVDVENYRKRLISAIHGNFPGSELANENGVGVLPCLKNSLPYSVASASIIPGEKSEKFISQTIEKLLDGIVPDSVDKEYMLILLATPIRDVDSRKLHLADLYSEMAPYAAWQTNYTFTESDSTNSSAVFGINAGVSAGVQSGRNASVANSSGETDSTQQTKTDSQNETHTDQEMKTETDSTNDSVSDSDIKTEAQSSSQSNANTTGETKTRTEANSHGSTNTQTNSSSKTDSSSVGHTEGESTGITGSVGASGGIKFGEIFEVGANASVGTSHTNTFSNTKTMAEAFTEGVSSSSAETFNHSLSNAISNMASNTVTDTVGQTTSQAIGRTVAKNIGHAVATSTGKSIAKSVGTAVANTLGHAVSKSVTVAQGVSKAVNLGGNFGANFARSSNVSAMVGKNEGIQQSFTNYNIKHVLELLEGQMKRLEESTALGMWDFAAYVLSEDQNVANNVARSYVSLTRGETSYMSQIAVNLWRGDMGGQSDDAREICDYLRELRHPMFGLNPALTSIDETLNVYPEVVTAATGLSGKELAYSLNFPQRSVSGLPVLECAEFGREVVSYDSVKPKDIYTLGQVFHMNHAESRQVDLAKNALTSHVFITGSTGSGKSNTVYQLLAQAQEENTPFLVIEPAKGEYKDVFGSDSDVSVFGTNPYLTPMLRVNPFSFSEKIHILEHIDRLIEIFNVCWPMYAAMPAVLKRAVEEAYLKCGWDLLRSVNQYGERIYPTFDDVAESIKKIIDTSEYDAENKGAYKGSLLTRLQSLTTGINGLVFTSDEIRPIDLFDKKVIIDLSRVGSSETKALLMGMLILKLQEYRITERHTMNRGLKHITVLEEAHNILRRTSMAQSPDSANLMGKSVEMLSNAIAEMRSFGEGFIIVDQAPGLLDMAAIRNTNTKIIMRLPDQEDRELVGKAANLNDDQIRELAKLPCGVAAVYQNEWIQPVLCQVFLYEHQAKPYSYVPGDDVFHDMQEADLTEALFEGLVNKGLFREGNREELAELTKRVISSKLKTSVKSNFMEYLQADDKEAAKCLRKLLFDFFSAKEAIDASRNCADINEWVKKFVRTLHPSIKGFSKEQIDRVLGLLLYEQTERDTTYNDLFCRFTEICQTKGGVY